MSTQSSSARFPRYVRVYDNGGKTLDRYTVVFTGRYKKRVGEFIYLGMSTQPFSPVGFGQHGGSDTLIDRPGYAHLGKKISFSDLPDDCQRCALTTYSTLWKTK